MRLFLAIRLSDAMGASVADAVKSLKKQGVTGRFVPVENLHLTLAFLGEVEDPAPVTAAMEKLRFSPFPLELTGLGTFRDLLWVGLRGSDDLDRLVRDLRKALDEAGVGYDRKKFVPHITLARRMRGPWSQAEPPRGRMTVENVFLMESRVTEGRRVYLPRFKVSARGKR